jgi:hypothetical protein
MQASTCYREEKEYMRQEREVNISTLLIDGGAPAIC